MTIENASIEKLLKNESFVKELIIAKTDKDIKELFAKNGVDLQDQQLHELKVEFSKVYQDLKKLDKQQLNQIAGGKLKEGATDTMAKFGVVGGYVGSLAGSLVGSVGECKGKKNAKAKGTLAGTLLGATAGVSLGAIVSYSDELKAGVDFLVD